MDKLINITTMGQLYLVSDNAHFPGEVLFNGCFDTHFQIKRITGTHQLLNELEQHKGNAINLQNQQESQIVILSLSLEKISSTVAQIKTLSPTVICLAIIEGREEKSVKLFEADCLFIERPLNEFHAKSMVASANQQIKLLQQLNQVGYIDERSGLYSQRYFLSRLNTELSSVRRHQDTLSCIVFGLRYYDMYLDCYGYTFIEQLFNHIGDIFKKHIRQEDIVARLGDDEIGLLMPRSQQEGAQTLALRIIENIEQSPFHFMTESESLVLCAGVFGYQAKGEQAIDLSSLDADQAVRYARHALHHAKKQDGSQASIFSELYPLD